MMYISENASTHTEPLYDITADYTDTTSSSAVSTTDCCTIRSWPEPRACISTAAVKKSVVVVLVCNAGVYPAV